MKRKSITTAGAVVLAVLVSALFSGPVASAELKKFTFMFPTDSVTQYHPFYIARKLGFFADEGLDVEFQNAGGSSSAIRQVIAGNADAGLPSPGAFLNAVAQGQDLRWVFSFQYANIFTLVTPVDSGISSVKDLKGKTVGVSELSGGEVPLIRAVLRAAGLKEGIDVKLIPVGEGSALTVNALQKGQVDAYSSSLFDVAAIGAKGIKLKVILPENARDFPSNGIVVTAAYLKKNRDRIVGFARALRKGIEYSKRNDKMAFEMAAKIAPEEFEDRNYAKHAWAAARILKTPPEKLAYEPIGTHFKVGFQAYHDFLRKGSEEEGALPKDVDLDKVLDSSLISEINQ